VTGNTYVLGADTVQDTYTLVRKAIRKLTITISKRLDLITMLPSLLIY